MSHHNLERNTQGTQNASIPIWEATLELRYLKKGKSKVLQQRYFDRANGTDKWEDIPEVEE